MGDNNGKSTRVRDPFQHFLTVIAIGIASWALTQVQEHSKILSAITSQVKHVEDGLIAAENRAEVARNVIRADIREIRNHIEHKQ